MDMAKRLLDFGFHPPTVYFPLIVDEAMMIEPTESENLETLDRFAEAMALDRARGRGEPGRPSRGRRTRRPFGRVDEAGAAEAPQPVLEWSLLDDRHRRHRGSHLAKRGLVRR